ncbi:MAG TPA: hypothetical protein ENI80_07720 [Acidiferrobacteraceae bacterium]|nr:hypothetical protein [Acidiferrobacteraceae bacterium]
MAKSTKDIPTLTTTVGATGDNLSHLRHYKILLSILVTALLVLTFSRSIDDLGKRYNDAAFKRAFVTFAIARGLNGLISVAQGTEVALQPAGLGLVFAPGQIFDPINDLVEQFAHVMLIATTSLGAQKILMQMSAWWAMNVMVLVAALLVMWALWWPQKFSRRIRSLIFRFALVIVFLRFVLPVVTIMNEHTFEIFLAEQYQSSSQVLGDTRDEIRAINDVKPRSDGTSAATSFIDRLSQYYENTTKSISLDGRISRYKEKLSHASEHAINLIVVFLLQTVLFPIAFVWLGFGIFKFLVRQLRPSRPVE